MSISEILHSRRFREARANAAALAATTTLLYAPQSRVAAAPAEKPVPQRTDAYVTSEQEGAALAQMEQDSVNGASLQPSKNDRKSTFRASERENKRPSFLFGTVADHDQVVTFNGNTQTTHGDNRESSRQGRSNNPFEQPDTSTTNRGYTVPRQVTTGTSSAFVQRTNVGYRPGSAYVGNLN